jgi:hypothetical protein
MAPARKTGDPLPREVLAAEPVRANAECLSKGWRSRFAAGGIDPSADAVPAARSPVRYRSHWVVCRPDRTDDVGACCIQNLLARSACRVGLNTVSSFRSGVMDASTGFVPAFCGAVV